jgi:hypothetical protein
MRPTSSPRDETECCIEWQYAVGDLYSNVQKPGRGAGGLALVRGGDACCGVLHIRQVTVRFRGLHKQLLRKVCVHSTSAATSLGGLRCCRSFSPCVSVTVQSTVLCPRARAAGCGEARLPGLTELARHVCVFGRGCPCVYAVCCTRDSGAVPPALWSQLFGPSGSA